jgi:hypothetical protein
VNTISKTVLNVLVRSACLELSFRPIRSTYVVQFPPEHAQDVDTDLESVSMLQKAMFYDVRVGTTLKSST